ncbi:MAG TPA: DmsC/YnfH family molybdoenzyme membrane anchor subunit [Bryobacteraceae bacterium]|nr:DmsC/YnfH family molybdoenzyme membrane anchor subunit [Bryobacteraceae bacterium]
MSLLLLDRAREGHSRYRLSDGAALIPAQPPAAGEQYRFHFAMSKCIGCRCCEVACSEQNDNPIERSWRRVGEIEGGAYPFTQRFYLSMGCNHCLDAACLRGCPVDAYRKDAATGLVLHSADTCIGCQYCTWNCPYGVPQYNPERGVVAKCDMCYGRLAEGLEPACVNACPQGAIQVELVNIAEWRADHAAANAPGMPAAEYTVSTTRITLPEKLAATMEKADYHRVRPEHPHIPLVFMLVFTQLAVGAFLCLPIFGITGFAAVAAPLAVALLSLSSSMLHLGRPIHAYRAIKMWRRSWLSREVLAFSLFAGAAALCAVLPWRALTAAAALLGLAGITASACIYLVPARPAWNSKHTLADFHLTAWLLGPLFMAALGAPIPPVLTLAAASTQLLNLVTRLIGLSSSEEFELRASARLLGNDLKHRLTLRIALLIAGGVALPLLHLPAAALLVALTGELLGRYLFFVSVVPRNMAASFLRKEAA